VNAFRLTIGCARIIFCGMTRGREPLCSVSVYRNHDEHGSNVALLSGHEIEALMSASPWAERTFFRLQGRITALNPDDVLQVGHELRVLERASRTNADPDQTVDRMRWMLRWVRWAMFALHPQFGKPMPTLRLTCRPELCICQHRFDEHIPDGGRCAREDDDPFVCPCPVFRAQRRRAQLRLVK
jgi:hypothetical protein